MEKIDDKFSMKVNSMLGLNKTKICERVMIWISLMRKKK